MTDSERNIKIDILKTISVFFVIISHLPFPVSTRNLLLFPFWIDMAVPVFMILTAVNFSNGISKKNCVVLKDFYSADYIRKQSARIFPLFIILHLAEVIVSNQGFIKTSIYFFTDSSSRPGSYYPIIFIQISFLMPIIYFSIRNHQKKALIVITIIQVFTEAAWRLTEYLSGNNYNSLYRLTAFRYLIFIAVGCYYTLYLKGKKHKLPFTVSFLSGMVYIIFFCIIDIKTLLFNTWTTTSMPTVLYIAPIVFTVLNSKLTVKNKTLRKIFILSGKSTYHIFICQSAWFFFFYNIFHKQIKSVVIFTVISIISCVGFGILAFLAENKIKQKGAAYAKQR